MKQNVVIYVKQGCPHCARAKELLKKKEVKCEEIDVLKNPDSFNEIKSQYKVWTVPQIFIIDENGHYKHHIPGNDILQKLEKEGKLDDMLNNDYDNVNVPTYTGNDIECEGGCTVSSSNCDDLL